MMHSPRAEGDGISEQRGDKVSKYQVAFLPLHLPPTPEPYLLKRLQAWRKQKAPPARQDLHTAHLCPALCSALQGQSQRTLLRPVPLWRGCETPLVLLGCQCWGPWHLPFFGSTQRTLCLRNSSPPQNPRLPPVG